MVRTKLQLISSRIHQDKTLATSDDGRPSKKAGYYHQQYAGTGMSGLGQDSVPAGERDPPSFAFSNRCVSMALRLGITISGLHMLFNDSWTKSLHAGLTMETRSIKETE